MTRPQKVREIYAELKSALGDSMASSELLECASLILDASDGSLYDTNVSLQTGRPPFSELPVDVVIDNWGWRVMNREMTWEDDFFPDVPQQFLIEQCLARAA